MNPEKKDIGLEIAADILFGSNRYAQMSNSHFEIPFEHILRTFRIRVSFKSNLIFFLSPGGR